MNDKCRLCLGNGESVSIFGTENSTDICFKVMSLSSVKISDGDHLPEIVCKNCLVRLDDTYSFKQLCEESDLYLRKKYVHKIIVAPELHIEINSDEFNTGDESNREKTVKKFAGSVKLRLNRNEKVQGMMNVVYSKIDVTITDHLKVSDKDTEIALKKNQMIEKLTSESLIETKRVRNRRPSKQDLRNNRKSTSKPCHTCGKLISANWMKCHMRIHSGETVLPHACQYCDKKFRFPYNLKAHELTHTGEKPLLCGTCGKTFSIKWHLTSHMKIHTGEAHTRSYKCKLCSIELKYYSSYQYHMYQHTGEKNFECDVCNKAFITKADLTEHIKIHTGLKSHVCSACGYLFLRASTLRRHMLTHTGEKPHKCHECNVAFVKKTDLTKHLKNHADQVWQQLQTLY